MLRFHSASQKVREPHKADIILLCLFIIILVFWVYQAKCNCSLDFNRVSWWRFKISISISSTRLLTDTEQFSHLRHNLTYIHLHEGVQIIKPVLKFLKRFLPKLTHHVTIFFCTYILLLYSQNTGSLFTAFQYLLNLDNSDILLLWPTV